MGGMVYAARWCCSTNPVSMNEVRTTSPLGHQGEVGDRVGSDRIMRASGVVMEH